MEEEIVREEFKEGKLDITGRVVVAEGQKDFHHFQLQCHSGNNMKSKRLISPEF